MMLMYMMLYTYACTHMTDYPYVQVFSLPFDAITEQHLQAAKLKLMQFDVLLLLEEPDKDDLLLQALLGWNNVCCHANQIVQT